MLSRTFITLAVSICLEAWLAALLYRRRVYKNFSVFFGYIAFSVLASLARLLTFSHYSAYYYVYWASELLLILLSVAALNQVFWYTYDVEDFRWFRWLYYGAILLALGLTIRMVYVSPPVQKHPIVSFLLESEITANFVRASIVAVYAVMIEPMTVEFQRYPFGIILGFGASSFGPCICYFIFSVFGTRVNWVTDLVAAVSYIIALVMWLWIFRKPDTEPKHMEPPMPPEEMMGTIQGYLEALGFSGKRKK